jgi:hypothetical protein
MPVRNTQDFHVAGEDLGRHRRDWPVLGIDAGDRPEAGLFRADPVQDAHSF